MVSQPHTPPTNPPLCTNPYFLGGLQLLVLKMRVLSQSSMVGPSARAYQQVPGFINYKADFYTVTLSLHSEATSLASMCSTRRPIPTALLS